MISKAQTKFIKSLQLKKHRKIEQCFIVEGRKSVIEVINSDYHVKALFGTKAFFEENDHLKVSECYEATPAELTKLGTFKSNDSVLAVVKIPMQQDLQLDESKYTLVLDTINDPGNLGTLIRIADWYRVENIIASKETADLYNPKVISATKGSFTHVNMHYLDLEEFLSSVSLPVYSAEMQGENIHAMSFTSGGILLMGNEANGVNPNLQKFVTKKITIPRFGQAESLNVAIATGIILDNIVRG